MALWRPLAAFFTVWTLNGPLAAFGGLFYCVNLESPLGSLWRPLAAFFTVWTLNRPLAAFGGLWRPFLLCGP